MLKKLSLKVILAAVIVLFSIFKIVSGVHTVVSRHHEPIRIVVKAETDSEIVELGRRLQNLIGLGHEVYLNGKPVDKDFADEMANY